MQIPKALISPKDYYKKAFWCGHCLTWILKVQLINGNRCPYCGHKVRIRKRVKKS
jgi:DNA-directed RNA polymerase subunit RPC12/RpoP